MCATIGFFCSMLIFAGGISLVDCHLTTSGNDDSSDLKEFCQLETMKARCRWNSEVIVMTSARWGRMRTSRCLDIHSDVLSALGHNPLFLGCSEDVLPLIDKKCSGRPECDVRIPDPVLDNVKPCYPDLTRYFEASYTCVRVVQENRSCKIQVTAEPEHLPSRPILSDVTTMTSSCGSKSHPWRLDAPAGQRINISLLDFAASGTDRNGLSRDRDVSCQQYGYVVEKSNKKNVSLCAEGGAGLRESAVYTSDTNSVEIVLDRNNASQNNFLIRVEAVGCTNVVPPDNAWLKRSNNDIIIGCYSSQQTWQLKCDGRDWKGHIGTCPELYAGTISPPENEIRDNSTTMVLIIVVAIAGATFVLCVLVIAIGCVCIGRYKSPTMKKLPPHQLITATDGYHPNDSSTFNRVAVSAGTQQLPRQPQRYCDERQQTEPGNMATVQYFLLDSQQAV